MLKRLFVISAALMALLASGPLSAAILLDRVVAVVNEEAITWGDLYRDMEFNLTSQMKALGYSERKKIFEENESEFLEEMITKRLQLQEARRRHISVDDRDIDAAIEGVKQKYGLDEESFRETLAAEGFTYDEYRKRLAEQLMIGRLLDLTIRSKIVITDEDVLQYTGGEYDAFYLLRQILLTVPDSGDMTGVQEKASAIMAELEAGADFGMLAMKYSEGPFAKEAGALGFVQLSEMSREFRDAVSGLSVGQVTRPFRTSGGVHIVKLERVRSIRDFLADRRFDKEYAEWLRELREKSFIEIRL